MAHNQIPIINPEQTTGFSRWCRRIDYRILVMGYFFLVTGLLLCARPPLRAQTASETPQTDAGNETIREEKTEAAEPLLLQAEAVMEIKQLDLEKPLYSFELRDVEIGDLLRVLAHDYKLNLLVDKEVSGKVTASLSNISLEEALETIAESQNLNLKKKGNIILVNPNLVTKIFTLKFIEAKDILESPLSADTSRTSSSGMQTSDTSNTTKASPSSVGGSETTQPNTIYDLLSDKGKILLGKQPNSLVVIDYPPFVERIGMYLKEIDQKMTSRVFKLKYLKAAQVVGQASGNSTPVTDADPGTNTTAGSF
jgi:type II secretory pathway component HofQ